MSIKESLKIFVDAYLLNKEFQGIKTYVRELYKEFSRRNPNVQIYFGCFESKELIKEYKEFDNINLIFYSNQNRVKRMLIEIPKLIEKYEFDFAHFQYLIPLQRSSKTRYIVTIHDILFNDFLDDFTKSYKLKRNSLFKFSAKKSDYLCTVSEYSSERIKEVYKINKPIYITPNGVNKKYFSAYNKTDEENLIETKFNVSNYLLYVSRIEPRKNHHVVLRLFKQLDPNYQLVFIGERTFRNKELEKELSNLDESVMKRIHFFNGIDDNDLLSFIRASKAFIYPSKAEGFGIPPLEAGAAKIPVLSSNATAMGDFDFFEPYHINFQNEEEVFLSLQKMLSHDNSSRLDDISSAIERQYSWERSCIVLESIIKG